MPYFRLVHFFGPDGAGKSTQVELLVRRLRNEGINAEKCWIRSPHTLAFVLSMLLLKIGFYRVSITSVGKIKGTQHSIERSFQRATTSWDVNVNPWRSLLVKENGTVIIYERIPAINKSLMLRSFWGLLEFGSVLPVLIYRVYLRFLFGKVLIAERYVLDTIVTIAYFMDDIKFLSSRIATALLKLIPKESVLIFLDSSYDTILKRRGCHAEVKSFINFQRRAYRILAKRMGALVIDTSRFSIDETADIIIEHIRLHTRSCSTKS
ncbi:MAG: hypothetical protein QXF61_03950 [Nitrososphaeria archaeon]